MKKKKIAVYPGSFDPPTYGHIDIITRSIPLFDKVIIALLENPAKMIPFFSVEDRIQMLKDSLKGLNGIEVVPFKGLLVDCMSKLKATIIIRGLRFVSDFEYEMQMALMNQSLDRDVETVFMVARPEKTFISSSLVKEVAKLGRDISAFVPQPVESLLKKRYKL